MNNRILGFSCVENHVLKFLQSRCDNPGLLYFDCFMPLEEIYKFAQQDSFEFFSGVQRIQDVLKSNSLLKIELYSTAFSDFMDHIQNADNDTQILMLMNAVNTQRIFCARGLREDHYVDVSMKDDKLILTNDIPNKKVELSKGEVEKLYSNNFLELKYKPFYSAEQISHIEKQRKYPIAVTSAGIDTGAVESSDFPVVFRNTLVLLKTMRERLREYLIAKDCICDISDEIVAITKLIAQTEYMRLKKLSDKNKYAEMINQINEIDRQIFNKIKGVLNDGDNQ